MRPRQAQILGIGFKSWDIDPDDGPEKGQYYQFD